MEKHLENFKEFNLVYHEYLNLKSEENLNALNRNLAVILNFLVIFYVSHSFFLTIHSDNQHNS